MFTSIFDDDFFTNFDALMKIPTYQSTTIFPPMNVYTTDAGMTYEFALAGYSKKELTITIEGNSLVVKGTPAEATKPENIKYYGTPRIRKATFTIKKPISEVLDAKQLRATFTDGLLTVFIPLKEKKEPENQTIEIL